MTPLTFSHHLKSLEEDKDFDTSQSSDTLSNLRPMDQSAQDRSTGQTLNSGMCRSCMVWDLYGFLFKHSTFVGSAWPFVFSSPPQRPMTSDFIGFLSQISTSDISTLRVCRRICKVPNSVPIHSIYIYSV